MTSTLPLMYASQQFSLPPAPSALPAVAAGPPDPTPIPATGGSGGSSVAGDPLAGFTVQASAGDRQRLASALQQVQSTSVGAQLLAQVRGLGITIAALDDATFSAATGGEASDAVAVLGIDRFGGQRLYVRASGLTNSANPTDAAATLAHELTHAVQNVAGENETTYRRLVGGSGAALSLDQARTGAVVMKESGAEFVATAVQSQLEDPTGFAQKAVKNLGAASRQVWDAMAGLRGYNPQGYRLPAVLAPSSDQLVRTALGLTR